MINFNEIFTTGDEIKYINQAIQNGRICGGGYFTKQCLEFFKGKYGFEKSFLTQSCTDALEMAAILLDLKKGDEIIMPSYTFVSTANAFLLRGAKIRFADSSSLNPNIDPARIEELINENTRAIVVIHYAGMACDMDKIMEIAKKHNLFVIEDAAQAIDAFYNGKPLGSIGDISAFSFHETKNIVSGEGGMIVLNNQDFFKRSECIIEKGTNRLSFNRGEVNKYTWVELGSSYLPSEITAAYLYAQLNKLDFIQKGRVNVWNFYRKELACLENDFNISIPRYLENSIHNGHVFYLILHNNQMRNDFIKYMSDQKISSYFHYQTLHNSPYFKDKHDGRDLKNATKYSECLVRLPLHVNLSNVDLEYIVEKTIAFFKKYKN